MSRTAALEQHSYDEPPDPRQHAERLELRAGLLSPLPSIPSKYFYDDRGSELFEAITRQPEYYLTRVEEQILRSIAQPVVDGRRPRELVELGSGAGRKIRLLLDAMQHAGTLERCVMLDINQSFLVESMFELGRSYPGLAVTGIVGDFLRGLDPLGPGGRRMMLFFASTIGNLQPDVVPRFLARTATHLAPGDGFLVGLDIVKERAVLEAAYNDAEGVTAEFNRNILYVVNDRFGSNFEPGSFDHRAFFDERLSRIEMRLVATRDMRVRVSSVGVDLALPRGGEILTEISCKYTRASFEALVDGTGLRLHEWFTDGAGQFALALLSPAC